MKVARKTLSFLAAATAMLLVTGTDFGRAVQARGRAQNSTTDASDTAQSKLARAMSCARGAPWSIELQKQNSED